MWTGADRFVLPLQLALKSMYYAAHDVLSVYSALQYVKDVDEDLARAAIRAVGQIALKASCPHPHHSKGRCMQCKLQACACIA